MRVTARERHRRQPLAVSWSALCSHIACAPAMPVRVAVPVSVAGCRCRAACAPRPRPWRARAHTRSRSFFASALRNGGRKNRTRHITPAGPGVDAVPCVPLPLWRERPPRQPSRTCAFTFNMCALCAQGKKLVSGHDSRAAGERARALD